MTAVRDRDITHCWSGSPEEVHGHRLSGVRTRCGGASGDTRRPLAAVCTATPAAAGRRLTTTKPGNASKTSRRRSTASAGTESRRCWAGPGPRTQPAHDSRRVGARRPAPKAAASRPSERERGRVRQRAAISAGRRPWWVGCTTAALAVYRCS